MKKLLNIILLLASLFALYTFIFVIEVEIVWRIILIVIAIVWLISAISNLLNNSKDRED